MNLKIFVTGIAGFLGSHIARQALAAGWDVTGIDSLLGGDKANVPTGVVWAQTDCRNPYAYRHLIKGADVVYHCAAAPYEGLSVFSPEVVAGNTFMATVVLLREAITAGAGRVVYCSSMSRYGRQEAPFTEDMPTSPVDPYGICKSAAEQMTATLCDLHDLEYVIAIPHNIYGPQQRYWDPYRNVAAIMSNRVLAGKPPIVYGDGSQVRCLSYIADVTGPLLAMATSAVAGEVINIGPDDPGVSMTELAQTVAKLADRPDLEPVYFPPRPAEVHTATCSAAKARALLNYEPHWTLENGLTELIAWIRQSGPRPFDYHLPIELPGPSVPATWTQRLM